MLLLILLVSLTAGCSSRAERPETDAGTARMVQVLQRLRQNMPLSVDYENARRAEALREAPGGEAPSERLTREGMRALELLQAGSTEEAIALIKEIQARVAEVGGERGAFMMASVRRLLALSYLRLGEQENCVLHHAAESCIIPIRSEAVHQLPRGSRLAIAEYQSMLEEYDADDRLGWQWLLNLAHMTLGTYPDQVPRAYLIPPEAFESEFDIGRFRNVAGELGLDVNENSGGAVAEDFDNDGDVDIMASSWNLDHQVRYFANNGDGTFTERTAEAGITGITGGLNMNHADYNNDGFADVLVLRGAWYGRNGNQPNSLLRNNGDGTFSDVTFEAGIYSEHPTQTAAWADYDGDGWLDLFIGNETTLENVHPSELYRNNGDGTFSEVARHAGVQIRAYAKGTAWGDFNNDNRPDLYVSTFAGPNYLFVNRGPGDDGEWQFEDVAASAGAAGPDRSFPTWVFDFDNDGWDDIFVSGYAAGIDDVAAEYLGLPHEGAVPRLYRNNRDGTFTDVAAEVNLDKIMLTMGCNYGDVDNDGFLDFYVGTGNPDLRNLMPNRMFRNAGGQAFQEITTSAGVGHLQKGHGVSFADFDQDGDLDIYAVMGGAYEGDIYRNVLFENPGQGNRWLGLQLRGTRSNRAAIGARVRVIVADSGTTHEIHRTVTTGASFGSNPFRLHVGLGRGGSVQRVDVRWPSGETQSFEGLQANADYRLVEGNPTAEQLAVTPFAFRTTGDTARTHAH